jgi:hypothetical protein
MAIFLTRVEDGVPRFAYKPNASFRLSPDGAQAILEFDGNLDDYEEVKADPDTTELTREAARQLAREWDVAVWGGLE